MTDAEKKTAKSLADMIHTMSGRHYCPSLEQAHAVANVACSMRWEALVREVAKEVAAETIRQMAPPSLACAFLSPMPEPKKGPEADG